MTEDDCVISNKDSVQEIYDILVHRDTLGNPLASMLGRNLRVFAKINLVLKKELRQRLCDWRPAQALTDKLKDFIRDANVESRFILMGFD